MVQMNLEKNLRKEIQKKMERGTGAAGPTPPPFRPSQRPGLPPPPLSPARAAPASLHPAPAMWRPYAGVVDAPRPTGLTWSGRRPEPPGRSTRSVARSSSSARKCNRSRRSSAAAPSPEKLRCSPSATPVPQPRRQNHQRTRRRRGKLLRTLYRGESPSNAVNRSSELLRPRFVSASFRLLFGALDP